MPEAEHAVPLEDLELVCRELGRTIESLLPEDVGFMLFVFEFSDEPGAWGTFLSNANREDLVRSLQELIWRLKESSK